MHYGAGFTRERQDHVRRSSGITAIASFVRGTGEALRAQREDRKEVAIARYG